MDQHSWSLCRTSPSHTLLPIPCASCKPRPLPAIVVFPLILAANHDIAGANEAGISSIFITGGIHSDDFDCSIGEIPDKKTLQELFEKENSFPTHVAPLLKY